MFLKFHSYLFPPIQWTFSTRLILPSSFFWCKCLVKYSNAHSRLCANHLHVDSTQLDPFDPAETKNSPWKMRLKTLKYQEWNLRNDHFERKITEKAARLNSAGNGLQRFMSGDKNIYVWIFRVCSTRKSPAYWSSAIGARCIAFVERLQFKFVNSNMTKRVSKISSECKDGNQKFKMRLEKVLKPDPWNCNEK